MKQEQVLYGLLLINELDDRFIFGMKGLGWKTLYNTITVKRNGSNKGPTKVQTSLLNAFKELKVRYTHSDSRWVVCFLTLTLLLFTAPGQETNTNKDDGYLRKLL